MTSTLHTEDLELGYGALKVVKGLSVRIPQGEVTMIVGTNACGKSTLLRGLARLLSPSGGHVYLDGKSIHTLRSKDVAAKPGILPQGPTAPEGITVSDRVPAAAGTRTRAGSAGGPPRSSSERR
jgi:iron complex transport system ATP-binding protein